MDKNVENLIEELKNVVLNLHRSAGRLDDVIQSIENETKTVSDKRYLKAFILAQANYRRNVMSVYGDFDEEEKSIWLKIDQCLKRES